MRRLFFAAALVLAAPAHAQTRAYGRRGVYPVYETAGQWAIFDKAPRRPNPLALGARLLVIGSRGAQVFTVARASGTWGGACRDRRPVKLRAALLRGPRRVVGRPIIALRVPARFVLKDSRARYRALANRVSDATYKSLEGPIKEAAMRDLQAGSFPLRPDDAAAQTVRQSPKPEDIQVKIDFAAPVPMAGVKDAWALVEETQVSASTRRCLRLASGGRLLGPCAPMRRELMAETDLLEFVAYDPSGRGSPFLLAFTKSTPMWGDERWGFVLRPQGPQPFLADSMDVRCREGF